MTEQPTDYIERLLGKGIPTKPSTEPTSTGTGRRIRSREERQSDFGHNWHHNKVGLRRWGSRNLWAGQHFLLGFIIGIWSRRVTLQKEHDKSALTTKHAEYCQISARFYVGRCIQVREMAAGWICLSPKSGDDSWIRLKISNHPSRSTLHNCYAADSDMLLTITYWF